MTSPLPSSFLDRHAQATAAAQGGIIGGKGGPPRSAGLKPLPRPPPPSPAKPNREAYRYSPPKNAQKIGKNPERPPLASFKNFHSFPKKANDPPFLLIIDSVVFYNAGGLCRPPTPPTPAASISSAGLLSIGAGAGVAAAALAFAASYAYKRTRQRRRSAADAAPLLDAGVSMMPVPRYNV